MGGQLCHFTVVCDSVSCVNEINMRRGKSLWEAFRFGLKVLLQALGIAPGIPSYNPRAREFLRRLVLVSTNPPGH